MTGDLREIDAQELYITLRDHAARNRFETVREIGHFCAHRRERDQGITFNRADEFCAFALPMIAALNDRPILEPLRTSLNKQAIRHADQLARALSVDKKQIREIAKTASEKVVDIIEGSKLVYSEEISNQEKELVELIWTVVNPNIRPYLQNVMLWDTFNLMRELGLVDRNDDKRFLEIGDYLTVFAMSRMHMAKIKGVPFDCYLYMHPSSKMINRLVVSIVIDGDKVIVPTTVYMSYCDIREWSIEDLHSKPYQPGYYTVKNWNVPLDFSTGKLEPFDMAEFKALPDILTNADPEPPWLARPRLDLNGPREKAENPYGPPA